MHDFLLLADGVSGKNKAHSTVLPRVLAMGAAAMELVDAGIVAMEARARGERAGKVRLRVGEEEGLTGADEVKEALKKCVVLLAEATRPDGGIQDSVQRIVEKEAECSGLFAGVVSA